MTLVELFSQPGTWTQGFYAKNRNGLSVSADDPTACKFCLLGGVIRCYGSLDVKILEKLRIAMGREHSIIGFNDAFMRTQDEILTLCKEAGV